MISLRNCGSVVHQELSVVHDFSSLTGSLRSAVMKDVSVTVILVIVGIVCFQRVVLFRVSRAAVIFVLVLVSRLFFFHRLLLVLLSRKKLK